MAGLLTCGSSLSRSFPGFGPVVDLGSLAAYSCGGSHGIDPPCGSHRIPFLPSRNKRSGPSRATKHETGRFSKQELLERIRPCLLRIGRQARRPDPVRPAERRQNTAQLVNAMRLSAEPEARKVPAHPAQIGSANFVTVAPRVLIKSGVPIRICKPGRPPFTYRYGCLASSASTIVSIWRAGITGLTAPI